MKRLVQTTINDRVAVAYFADPGQTLMLSIDLDGSGTCVGSSENIVLPAPEGGWNAAGFYSYRDLEFIRGDGLHFLVGTNMGATQIGVLELFDNLELGNSVTISVETNLNDTATYFMDMFEFAPVVSAPIPEPATMLLIGTGVLGVIGFLRRRRMG